MPIEEILERTLKDIEEAKKRLKDAEDLIAIGEEAGIDVSAQRAEAMALRDRITTMEVAIKARLKK
jgi:adenosyl cobinamide kinase/adenosyl cobinamide phosphate guanylyltransferase